MKKAKWMLGAAALGLVGLLGACGNASGTGDSNKVASGDKEEIEFFFQKTEMVDTMQKIIDDFEKENSDISVKLTQVTDGATVLKTRMAGGDAPDVVHVYPANADFKGWAESGVFKDLSDASYLSNITDGVPEQYSVKDKVYAIPLTNNAYGFFYNKDAFKKLGLEVPTTYDEFQQVVQKIKDDGKTPFSAALTTEAAGFLNGYEQLAWATAAGGYDQAEDALLHSAKGGIKADSATFKAVTKDLDLLHGNTQKNAQGATYDDSIAAFADGQALMFPNGSWALPAIQKLEPSFEIGTFAFPGTDSTKPMTAGAADLSVAISEKSKHQKAAQKFVEYLTTKEAMQPYFDVDGSPTFVKSVDTKGKFPELEGISSLVGTDQQIIWLHKDWTSEEDFWYANLDYIIDGDSAKYEKSLNAFFDTMQD